MRQLIPLLLLLTAAGHAQQTPAVFKKVFDAITAQTTSAPVVNIGQTMHLITVFFPAEVAAVSPIQVRLEASYDNTLYFPISADITAAPLIGGVVYQVEKGYGWFPYVRVRSLLATPGAKLMTVWYSGHILPVVPFITQTTDRFIL